MNFDRISVVGLGYIGLPTAAVIASRGVRVIGIDVNEQVVETVNRGEIHIVEPDLDMVVRSTNKTGFLTASTTMEPADAFLIAVPTPFKGENHEPDLRYIEEAGTSVAEVLNPGNLVILESTSPVGATEMLAKKIADARPDLRVAGASDGPHDVLVAHCPERVLPGRVLQELVENDRTIGGLSAESSEAARQLYSLFVKGELVLTDARTAELVKLTENAFRDVNIAFANELSLVCEGLGIDVWELQRLANRHPRVNVLQPGPGVGGHCIAVDPWFIVSSAPEKAKLMATARGVNDSMPSYVAEKALKLAQQHPDLPVVCFGLTFKPDIDDIRESPALQVTRELFAKLSRRVKVVEPNLPNAPEKCGLNVEQLSLDDALSNDGIYVFLVDHKQFLSVRRDAIGSRPVVDVRGVLPRLPS